LLLFHSPEGVVIVVKRCIVFLFASSIVLAAVPPRMECSMHAVVGDQGWLDLFGSWDEMGAPYLLSITYSNRWDCDLMRRDYDYSDRIRFVGESGKIYDGGVSVLNASHGNQRSWSGG
jgi:hypothetical protein